MEYNLQMWCPSWKSAGGWKSCNFGAPDQKTVDTSLQESRNLGTMVSWYRTWTPSQISFRLPTTIWKSGCWTATLNYSIPPQRKGCSWAGDQAEPVKLRPLGAEVAGWAKRWNATPLLETGNKNKSPPRPCRWWTCKPLPLPRLTFTSLTASGAQKT